MPHGETVPLEELQEVLRAGQSLPLIGHPGFAWIGHRA
jgi:hypothetical protein